METRTFRGITYTVETAPSNDQFLKGTLSLDWIEGGLGSSRASPPN